MSKPLPESIAKIFKEAIISPPHSGDITPAPVIKRSTTAQALKRCRAAWQRAYKTAYAEYMEEDDDEGFARSRAVDAAAEAYCNAMPILSNRDNIRDFVACVAHGILIDAIRTNRSSQLLYAAQVANCTIQRDSKSLKRKSSK